MIRRDKPRFKDTYRIEDWNEIMPNKERWKALTVAVNTLGEL